MQIALEGELRLNAAAETEAEQYDVRQLKRALNRLGYYTPDPKTGITSDIDEGFKDALYAFQRKATIFFDDVEIGPSSTTERILNQELARQNDDALYIWRTVGDE